jgi:type IV pilus assembly protein PilB
MLVELLRGVDGVHRRVEYEPGRDELRVRYRIDGILYNIMSPPMRFRDAIVSRIKIMAKLDIAEKRLPQDGRIKIRFNENGVPKEIDFRVSCLPTLFGEKIVMRLLDKDKLMLDMTKLGFEAESLAKFEVAIQKPWGMVLVTGPTGSGKTNTLYSSISKINTSETNIMTAEDPVEFNLVGVNQVQVREQIGLNFAAALRSFLRQDPNIILVGEIRGVTRQGGQRQAGGAKLEKPAAVQGPPAARLRTGSAIQAVVHGVLVRRGTSESKPRVVRRQINNPANALRPAQSR